MRFFLIILLSIISINSFTAITEIEAKNIANETLIILISLNIELNNITKKEDINLQTKNKIELLSKKLKTLENKVLELKKVSSQQEIAKLDSEFNTGQYSIALKKAVKNFFENIKRISKIEGGKEIIKILAI